MTIRQRAGLALGAWLALSVALYLLLAVPYPGAADFFPRWYGVRALVLEGRDPYALDVTLDIQRAVYGRPAEPQEDQVAFAYPLHLLWPLAVVAPFRYAVAQALWQAALLVVMSGTVLWLAAQYSDRRLSPRLVLGLVVWTIAFYPVARGVALGQLALLASALMILALVGPATSAVRRSAVLLACATLKPQVPVFFAAGRLARSLRQRSLGWPAWFTATLVVAALPAFLLVPSWPVEFGRAVVAYREYTAIAYGTDSALGLLLAPLGPASGWLTVAITVALLLALSWYWLRAAAVPSLDHGLGLATACATLLLIPAQGTPAQVLLLPAIVRWLVVSGWPAWGRGLVALTLLVAPWWLFALSQQRLIEHPLQFWLLPVAAGVLALVDRPRALRTTQADSRMLAQ